MSKAEILSRILSAEAAAERTLKKATEKAQNIMSKARSESAEIISEARSSGQENALGIVDAARTKAVKEADAVSADGDERIATIKNNSDSRRKDAVDVVLASFRAE